ncbi:transposon Tf2-6 polyprotein [Trichonephila clavipes]|nr:transposon Tf2-6 polyprotein [Trichonephila clavipes]
MFGHSADALDKFHYYLHGKKFIIHTDHAALVWLKNMKNLRGRLFRWSLKLSMFDYEVKYLKGTNNVEAYMLSRHPIAQYIQHSVHLLELNEIKNHQNLDNVNDPKYKKVDDVFVLKKKNLFKIVVPFSLKRQILQNAHEQFGHPGTQKMINFITPQYYWPHIKLDISKFVEHCNLLTTSHHPQTNGKCERVNQSIVTKLRCKVNSSPTKILWTKFLEQVINEYNLTPHSVTKFPPAYLLFGTLPYTPPLAQNQVYPPVEEARKLAKENTIKYHEKNKIKYDARFSDSTFEPVDLVIYEEFNYPNRRKLSAIISGPYEIVQKLSDVNYEITKPNALTKKPTEIGHVSKLRAYYPPEELKLSHE